MCARGGGHSAALLVATERRALASQPVGHGASKYIFLQRKAEYQKTKPEFSGYRRFPRFEESE